MALPWAHMALPWAHMALPWAHMALPWQTFRDCSLLQKSYKTSWHALVGPGNHNAGIINSGSRKEHKQSGWGLGHYNDLYLKL